MTIPVKIQYTRGEDPSYLVVFFQSMEDVEIQSSVVATRGEIGLMQISMTIAGTWAVERYILDPLADRLDQWIETLTSLVGKQFEVSITFGAGNLISIDTFRISSPLILGKLWQIIKAASDVLANNIQQVELNRILIVPDELEQLLIIGYQGSRPTHVLDLSSNRILSLESKHEVRNILKDLRLL